MDSEFGRTPFKANSDEICRGFNKTFTLPQFCCPVPLISTSPSTNIPVSPRFFAQFFGEFDMLTFTARHFEKKVLVCSSRS